MFEPAFGWKKALLLPIHGHGFRIEFYQELTVLLASLNKQNYQLTVLILAYALALRVTVFCLFVYYFFDVVAILYRKQ